METSQKVQTLPFVPHQTIIPRNLGSGIYRNAFKRVFDILLAILILPIILPISLFLFILIKIDSKGPAIYRSERVGRKGKKFNCLKFRTMCLDADKKLEKLLKEQPKLKEEYEKYCKLKEDPRVTRIGKLLRAFSLDELPQVFNILKGDMSFVGPRPAFETEILKYYGQKFNDYKKVRPGITGIWQINGRNDTSFENRVQMDSQYSNTLKFSQDIKILFKTIPAALSTKGAY